MSTRELAKYSSELTYDQIPVGVREKALDLILDLIGVTIYGSSLSSSIPLLRYVENNAGKAESTVFGSKSKFPATEASLSNGNSAHGPELDDHEHEGSIHVGTTVIPAVLAAGEREHSSGIELVTATVAGYDVAVRCALAVQGSNRAHYRRGFHPTATCGVFGATSSAGHIMGLKPDEMTHAFGIAGSQASGLLAYLNDGSWTKRFGVGRASQSGVLSATLAQLGYTGPRDILEGRNGFLQAYSDEPEPSRLVQGLGNDFSVMHTGVKFHACCRYNQAAIDSTLILRESNQFSIEEISEINVGVVGTAFELLNEPKEIRYRPKTVVDAQFSIPYCVAVSLVTGNAFVDEFTDDAIRNQNVLDVAKKVIVEHDPALDKEYPRYWPSWVRIKLNDGRTLEESVKICKGDADTKLERVELESKFETLTSRVLTETSVKMLLSSLRRLEEFQDIAELFDGIEYLKLH